MKPSKPKKPDPLKDSLTPEMKGARYQAMLDGTLAEFDRKHRIKGFSEKEKKEIEEGTEVSVSAKPEHSFAEEVARQAILTEDAQKAQELVRKMIAKRNEQDPEKAA